MVVTIKTVAHTQLDVVLAKDYSKIPFHTYSQKEDRPLCKSNIFLLSDYDHYIIFTIMQVRIDFNITSNCPNIMKNIVTHLEWVIYIILICYIRHLYFT